MEKKGFISLNGDSKLNYLEGPYRINDNSLIINSKIYFSNEISLPRGVRWLIFMLFVLLNMLMNMDHGTIPAATKSIKEFLHIDDYLLGILGSLVFVGNLLGSLISFTLINLFNRKYMLLVSLVCTSACLYTFTISKHAVVLFCNRVTVGIFQSFISIYLPVWVDQYGMRNKKSIWISLIQVAAPLGVVLGYFITTFFSEDNKQGDKIDMSSWQKSFIFQAIAICGLLLMLIFIPNTYFSTTLTVKNDDTNNLLQLKSSDVASIFMETSISDRLNDDAQSHSHSHSFYPNKISLFKNLRLIFRQKIFILCALSLANLFFIITAVQFWASDYLLVTLNISDKNQRLLSFSIVCVTSPTFGVVIGGIVSSFIGGYESKHSILLCFIFALIASCFAIPVPFVNDIISFTVYLWLVLFFGGGILSPLTGIIITTLPKELAGSANSITSFFSNLFGYLPAPFVYGIIKDYFKNQNKSYLAMLCVMYYSFYGVILLAIAGYLRYKSFGKDKDNFIHEEKMSCESKRRSSFSGNIGKVFGSYPNLEELQEIIGCGENEENAERTSHENKDEASRITFQVQNNDESVYVENQNIQEMQ